MNVLKINQVLAGPSVRLPSCWNVSFRRVYCLQLQEKIPVVLSLTVVLAAPACAVVLKGSDLSSAAS